MQRVLSTVTLLGLLAATAAAFVITEHLKLVKSPITAAAVTKTFSPVCGCATGKATIRIRLRHADLVTVTIQDSSRHTVATLATDRRAPKGFVTFAWHGRNDANAVVPDGGYFPEIALASARRTILLPNRIDVDTRVPRVLSASVTAGHDVLVPRQKHTIAIKYALSEAAHPVLYLGTKRLILGRRTRLGSELKWNGMRHGSALPDGRYVLELGAVDLAGNETPASGRKSVVVVIRSIALQTSRLAVHARARFTIQVRTAAAKYAWRFAGNSGTGRTPALQLRAPAKPGRYRLLVTAHGHSAVALVTVRRK